MLPEAPSFDEKRAYLKPGKLALYTFGVFSLLCLLAGMVLFSIQNPLFSPFLIFVLIVGLYLGLSYCIGIFGSTFDFGEHTDVVIRHEFKRPTVDVYLPSCGEPLDIIRNTFEHVKRLDWHPLNVYVLDDSQAGPGLKELAEEFGFHYMARPNRGELKKAGNLRYAFTRTSGDFFVVFDADFCPRPDFLQETIPHFYDRPETGIVQTPQFFRVRPGEQSWVEAGAGYIQELFYRLIQVNRNTWDASICVGTCAVYRRTALEPFGGTAPIGFSEDLHTGWMLLKAGWKTRYLPINLSMGVCPDSVSAFFIQQYRWCTGSTTLLMSRDFWETRVPFGTRLCYLSGQIYYWATAIGVFITPIPAVLMVWFAPEHVYWYNVLLSLPSFLYGTAYMAYWSRAPFGMYALKTRLVSYYAHAYAIWDKLKKQTIAWVPTGAKEAKTIERFYAFRRLLFRWSTFCLVAVLSGVFHHMDSVLDYHFYPMLFFTGLNYWLAMTVLRDQ